MGHKHSKASSSGSPYDGAPPAYSAEDAANSPVTDDSKKLQIPYSNPGRGSSSSLNLSLFGHRFGESDRPISPVMPREDELAMLRNYETWILVDDSSSMGFDGARCWHEARDALAALARVAGEYDADGIDMYFLNAVGEIHTGLRDEASVLEIFDSKEPSGATPIGGRLENLLWKYYSAIKDVNDEEARRNIKPVNILVITDGEPTDDPESVIQKYANKLDEGNWPLNQVGIQFVQVGKDSKASKYLQRLDDTLAQEYKIRDMVDTTPASKLKGSLNAAVLVKILLGGINRRQDRAKIPFDFFGITLKYSTEVT